MNPKKLDPQRAFDLLMKKTEASQPAPAKANDLEKGFGSTTHLTDTSAPPWKRFALRAIKATAFGAVIVGMIAFYTVITNSPSPETLVKNKTTKAPATISKEQACQIIETNLRRFLEAENIEEKARYVHMADEEMEDLHTHYILRGLRERPLWKVEGIRPVRSPQGVIWFATYLDLERRKHTVSFERSGDDFLLHWSAMTGFCDTPWPEFIVKRPEGPVTMRGYMRQYEGVWPVTGSQDQFHCFLIEDQNGLFCEIAIMKRGAYGCDILRKLPNTDHHPVTLELGYRTAESSEPGKHLAIISLKHLRWQKLGMDPRTPPQ